MTTTIDQIRALLDEAAELIDTPPAQRDALYTADRAAFLERKRKLIDDLQVADRPWPGIDLTHAEAAGLACVVCSHEYADRDAVSRPVGRAVHGGQVFACAEVCYGEAMLAQARVTVGAAR